MTVRGSADVGFLLVDGYDVLGVSTSLSDSVSAIVEETHALGDSWVENTYVGLKSAELSQEGYYDDDSDSSNDALSGSEGVSRLLCYGLEGNTIGKQFIGYSGAMQASYNRIVSRGELHRANASYQGNGAVEDGLILHEHSTEGAAGDTKSDDVEAAAQTAAGGAAYLQVSALTLGGYTNLIVTVLDSTDGVTWTTLATFTAVTTAPAAERKVVAGTVKKHLAVQWAYTGAGTGQSTKFFVGFDRY